jgi:hypothetical protein
MIKYFLMTLLCAASVHAINYNLTVTTTGTGTTDPTGATSVTGGVATAIAATAGTGWTFNRWERVTGTCTIADSTSATTTVTLATDATVRATFRRSCAVDSNGIATTIPVETEYYIPIEANKLLVTADMAVFAYQVDLSAILASNSTFKSKITTAANIAVYDVLREIKIPRIVTLDLTNNKLLISFNAPTSKAYNKKFCVCVGSGFSESDSSSVFSSSGYTNRWGFDDTAASTCSDDVGGRTISLTTMAKATGKFGKGLSSSTAGTALANNEIIGGGVRSIEFIYKLNTAGGIYCYLFTNSTCMAYVYNQDMYIRNSGDSPSAFGPQTTYGQYAHVVISRNSSGQINAYVNGDLVTYGADQAAGSNSAGSGVLSIGASSSGAYPMDGTIDELGITNNQMAPTYAKTRYNMFFGSFWTIGSGDSTRTNNDSLSGFGTYVSRYAIAKGSYAKSSRSSYLYEVDASVLMLDTAFKHKALNSSCVSVYDSVNNLVLAKRVTIDTAANYLLVSFIGSIVPALDRKFKIVAHTTGPNYDDAKLYANAGYSRHWGIHETNGSVVSEDVVNANGILYQEDPYNPNNCVYFGNVGRSGKSGYCSTPFNTHTGITPCMEFTEGVFDTSSETVEFLVKEEDWDQNPFYILANNVDNQRLNVTSYNRIYFTCGNGGPNYVSTDTNSMVNNVWQYVVMTKTNAGVINFYVDGVHSGARDGVVSGLDVQQGVGSFFNYPRGHYPFSRGSLSNIGKVSGIVDTEWISYRSNMFMQDDFWNVEGDVPPTKQFTMTNVSGHNTFTPATGLHDSDDVFSLTYQRDNKLYKFQKYVRSNSSIILSDSASPNPTIRMRADGTVTVVDTLIRHTLTVTSGTGGTVTPNGNVVLDTTDSQSVSASAAAHYHFHNWTVITGTATLGNSNSASTTVLLSTVDATVRANFYADSFTTTTSADPHAPITGGDISAPYGGYDTLIMTPDSGYGARLVGRPMVIWPNRDTLVVHRVKDSTVVSVAYPIPVIDSIRGTIRRDTYWNCVRRDDIAVFYMGTDIGDSGADCKVYLGRDTTGEMTIIGWYNNAVKDSVRCRVPNTATLNKNFRPIVVVRGIYSLVRTPITWLEKWILKVKGQVR